MSLKVFHVIFVTLAIALAGVCAAWSFAGQHPPVLGWCSLVAIVGLIGYGIWFLRKARNIIT